MRPVLPPFLATGPPQSRVRWRLPERGPRSLAYTVVRVPAPTLIDWLRAQDDQMLAGLLVARPDLATPAPPDTAVLAARAATRASVTRAAEGLDTFTLAVL